MISLFGNRSKKYKQDKLAYKILFDLNSNKKKKSENLRQSTLVPLANKIKKDEAETVARRNTTMDYKPKNLADSDYSPAKVNP